jgi:RelE toxin of RelEB toxin-antitoxin system
MIFIETAVFTRRINALVDEDLYFELQTTLLFDPEAGDLIAGAGGIRKIRMAANGHGKRGGARVIYYHFIDESHIGMLFVYAKNERDDLTAAQRKVLAGVVERWRLT